MSGLVLTPTNPTTDAVRPSAGKYRLLVGDGTNGTTAGVLYKQDSTGALTPLVPPAVTTEDIQDAVGGFIADSNTIDFTYDDAGNVESAVTRFKYLGLVTGASKVYSSTDIGTFYERSNSGAAMTDTLPALTAADNGYTICVHNIDTAGTLTFSTAAPNAAATFGIGVGTTYPIYPGCRQTFIWNGTAWKFGAGNNNLLKSPTAGTTVAGNLVAFQDAFGRTTGKATSLQVAQQSNQYLGEVNILDFGADRTGATSSRTALDSAIAALPNGGVVYFPAGNYNLGNTAYLLATAHITLRGYCRYNTNITTTSTTEDILQIGQYYNCIEDLAFIGPGSGENPTKVAGFAINGAGTGFPANTEVRRCSFFYQYSCINLANSLMNVEDIECKFFKGVGITVNHNSDHQISKVIMNNNASFLPTGGAGIRVIATASLQMERLNIISSNFALDLAPGAGVTIPSIKAVNSFFDTSAVGLNMTSAGFVMRSEFTNCWFSSMTIAGIRLNPTTAGGINGITFVNCDVYQNVGGTTTGIDTNTNVGKWKAIGLSVAGWTTGINLVAGAAHYPTITECTIGAVSAFGNNGTGIAIGAGSYKGILVTANDVTDNTTATIAVAAGVTTPTSDAMKVSENVGHLLSGQIGALVTAVATTGTTDAALFTARIPANGLTAGVSIRARVGGISSSTGVLTFRVHVGTAGTIADATVFTSIASGAQVANQHAWADVTATCRTAGSGGTMTAEGGGVFQATGFTAAVAAAVVASINTTVPLFITISASCTVGTFTAQVATVEIV